MPSTLKGRNEVDSLFGGLQSGQHKAISFQTNRSPSPCLTQVDEENGKRARSVQVSTLRLAYPINDPTGTCANRLRKRLGGR
jgi:hypothetical protein